MQKRFLWIGIAIVGLLFLVAVILSQRNSGTVQAQLVSAAPTVDTNGFTRAEGPKPLRFPEDYGPHPDYQTEWWYYTGNLDTSGGRHFGYQLTFFRRALIPPTAEASQRGSDWGTQQVYMAHFALTDVEGSHYQAFERLQRGAAGLAGAQAAPYQVWLEDWKVEETAAGVYQLQAVQDGLRLDLQLTDVKGPVLQGDQGLSAKGPQLGQASYYYSLTRLASSGTVQIGERIFPVEGMSWMDHEFSTSYLSEDQVGWDWFALQLDDGSELMVFQIRKADGTIDPFSTGILVDPHGATYKLEAQDFHIEVKDTWKSPRSAAVYPALWEVSIPEKQISLEIEPWLADQELNVSYAYWEGAVKIQGTAGGQPVSGNGYIELTGYTGSMGGEF